MKCQIRPFAQAIRHAPGLSSLEFLWDLLRPGYLGILNALSGGQGVPVKIAGHNLRLAAEYANVRWETVEAKSYAAFDAAISPNSIVYDVGSFLGTYSIVAAKRLNHQGAIVAYEPHDFTRTQLQRHLHWNGAQNNVIVRPVCCGAERGEANFYCLPGVAEATSSLVPTEGLVPRIVEVTTIDDEVERLELPPSVIKIDVEGAEFDVLRGATQTLRRHRPTILVSLHPEALEREGTCCNDVLRWLSEQEYQYEILGHDHEIHVLARNYVHAESHSALFRVGDVQSLADDSQRWATGQDSLTRAKKAAWEAVEQLEHPPGHAAYLDAEDQVLRDEQDLQVEAPNTTVLNHLEQPNS